MPAWLTFDDPRFELHFRYPAATLRDEPVERQESERGGVLRAHVLSKDRDVYFELRRFPLMAAEAEYLDHRPYLERRFPDLEITELSEARLGHWPAQAYCFRWSDGKRAVLLVPTDAALYRVIYNPRSALNHEILATVAPAGAGA